ncbi:transcriptional regulator [Peribacillus cavernae]|uniref:Transcriptional regulator n=1 Tax=Peribacillus cavernae TaxID=1674310 RepID=A0A3S0VW23_9BACI|nr:transcriptional regulator SplA domain-containing protein [Peribacillus cavernae]MDQ0220594.1 transcriptional regulator of the spore photoproduct lyase operon [Peribacillus cavernae]RUQ27347.1 transcriptional regulator [Peribacillus cavernae]
MEINQNYQPGEVVYIIIRNPHAQDVANVQQAAVVQDPRNPFELALFAHENYFPFSDEFAVFKTEEEAEQAYQEAFGTPDAGDFYG